jgi:type IV secretion system protein VirB4
MSNILNNILKRQNSVQSEIPPYTMHLTDKIVNLDNGRMLMVFELDGLLFESHENYRLQSFNDALTRLFTDIAIQYPDQIQYHTNIIRSKVVFEANYTFDNFFVQNFHEKYISRFNDKDYFKNSFYLAVVFKYDHMSQALIDMKEIENTLVHSLSDYRVHVLSTYRRVNGLRANDIILEADDEPELREQKEKYIEFVNRKGVLYSEVYEYLGRLINTYEKPQPLTGSFAYQILPEVNYFFGYDVVEIRGDRYKKYATCFDLKDFPLESKMGMFNMPLLDQQVEFIFTMCFTGINKHKAEGLVKDKLSQFRSVNDKADYQIQELDHLLAYIKNSELALGIFSSSLIVYGDTVDKAHLNGSNCRSLYLKDASTNFSKASLSAPVSYFSIMPAPLTLPRPMPKSTRNFANIFCMHNYSSGKPNFNPLGDGTALMPLETTSKNVFHFNFHVSPLHQNNIGDAAAGHTLFLGTTGVGKSVLQCALTANKLV